MKFSSIIRTGSPGDPYNPSSPSIPYIVERVMLFQSTITQ